MNKTIFKDPYRRNLRIIHMKNSTLEEILFGSGNYVLKNTLPKGVLVRNLKVSESCDCIDIVVKHPTFSEVAEGEQIPSIDPQMEIMSIQGYNEYMLTKLKE